MRNTNRKAFTLVILPILFFCAGVYAQGDINPKREFRGVWIATVANIDWPSKPGLSSEEQQKELIAILDNHQKSGINAVMLQIRPAADAFYGQGKELWSRFLTGMQGKAPVPYYDPLAFAIGEAHRRGMELHAWFNPYRATSDLIDRNTSPNHISKQKPEWFFTYSGKKLFNPGLPEVREYIISVIMDVVRNYDIDGVHFDDYFYPYPEAGQVINDYSAYQLYGANYKDINDWRRQNVDTLIHMVSDSIHHAKAYVKFGISPFGIWRNQSQDPEGSATNGLDGYGKLYADARKWVKSGWIDYINPQIYFPFNYAAAAYEKLVDWWSNNSFDKHLYIGIGAYRAIEKRNGWQYPSQIPDQIRYLRQNARVQGSIFFSSKSLRDNLAGLNDSLQTNFHKTLALPPKMSWLDAVAPNAPLMVEVQILYRSVKLKWVSPPEAKDGETAYGYVVYRFNEGEKMDITDPKNMLHISYDSEITEFIDNTVGSGKRYTYLITALDRLKNESEPSNHVGIKTN
ncbi:MAG: glycoside hydrolase family 10 protein [Sphingobacteriaceae bacterium]